MKHILNLILIATSISFILSACNKLADLPTTTYKSGAAPVLSSDATAFTSKAADSNKIVLHLSWTSPHYATDSSMVKYVVQIDSSGKKFINPATYTVTGTDSTSFTAKDFNNILLSLGFAYNTKYSIEIRVVSSYANNNDQQFSNIITMQVTPYVTPPKVMPPSSGMLFIVGSATAGAWGNPVPVPAQQFTKIDSVTYQGNFYFNGTGAYDLLPINGSWDAKYNVADATVPNINRGGSFEYSTGPGSDIPAPSAPGIYTVTVNFQSGIFTVTPASLFSELYVPGDYQGWAPATAPMLASPNNDGKYEGYVNVPAGGTYEFKLTNEPDWNGKTYGDAGNGTLSTSGGNFKFPGAGYYKINVDLTANTYSLTATTWSIIGSFAASGWSNDVDMTYNSGDNDWTATITIADGDQFKFRANHDWGLNYGADDKNGILFENDANIGDATKNFALSAGTYTVTLYLDNANIILIK